MLRSTLLMILPAVASATALAAAPSESQPVRSGLRQQALDGALARSLRIVFAVRGMGRDHHYYCNFGFAYGGDRGWINRYSHRPIEGDMWRYGLGGGKLCVLDLRTGKVRTLLEDPSGGIRDPQVHYDGRTILFSYRRGGEHRYHLYEINVDGSGLRQLTDGPDDDIEPIYTPDDEIIFCSTRSNRIVPCWFSEAATLYKCSRDGSDIRILTNTTETETTPWMLPDGRVVFTRWEYNERNQTTYHHLWTINPDGTGLMVYFGNMHSMGQAAICDAKPIPGTNSVLATWASHHGRVEHQGDLRIITPDFGPDAQKAGVEVVSDHSFGVPQGIYPEQKNPPMQSDANWRDPYPLGEGLFLVAAWKGLYLMDRQGRFEEIYRLDEGPADLMVHEPRPIRPRRREHDLPRRTQWQDPTGTMVVQGAHVGRNMPGVKAGQIRKLLVLEVLSRPISYLKTDPVSHNDDNFYLYRILGTVPVEPDGSAHFQVPGGRAIFFVSLDEKDLSVKRMQSLTHVMPGETVGCVGCHEPRTQAPPPVSGMQLQAVARPASRIQPIPGVPEIIEYTRDIQPIWDENCVSCHNQEKYAAELVLTGDVFSGRPQSYDCLYDRELVTEGGRFKRNRGNAPPRTIGTSASKLWKKVAAGHGKLDRIEKNRVWAWIEAAGPMTGTYGAIRARVGNRVRLDREVMKDTCSRCHKRDNKVPPIGSYHFDLENPANSIALRAPLAKDAGGLELCRDIPEKVIKSKRWTEVDMKSHPRTAIFKSKDEPGYRKLLADLKEAAQRRVVYEGPPWSADGFTPDGGYIKAMQRYGHLDPDWSRGDTIDVYELDEKYFQSFYPQSHPAGAISPPELEPQPGQGTH